MQQHRALRPGLLASSLVLLAGLASGAAAEIRGPMCLPDSAMPAGPIVNVVSLADLTPARAARIRHQVATARQGAPVIANAPGTDATSEDLALRLDAIANEQAAAFARLQTTEPDLLPNGFYSLNVAGAFMTPLLALPTADRAIEITHDLAIPAHPEVRP